MNYNILDTIKQAARQHLVLRMIYTEKDGTSEGWRYVEPYSFSGADGAESLFAWDTQKAGIRRFILSRISQADLSSNHFVPRYPIEII